MLNEIFYSIIQSATEFLPISSSGHLAFFSNLISEPNLFFITVLHLASLIAVLIFTRKEIFNLVGFEKKYRKIWLYIFIATVPAVLFALFFKDVIEKTFSSFLFLGVAFLFTGIILYSTKYTKENSKFNFKNSLFIGLMQVLSVFPAISRSGTTISAGLFSGIEKEKAVKFSFLLFIPLAIGAFILEANSDFYISTALVLSFFLTIILSILFLNLLLIIIKKNYFWMFSFYCWFIGLISLVIYFLT